MKLTSNKESIALVNDFMNENDNINEKIKKLKHDSNSFEANKIQRKVKNVLEIIDVIYSALETTKYLTQNFEIPK